MLVWKPLGEDALGGTRLLGGFVMDENFPFCEQSIKPSVEKLRHNPVFILSIYIYMYLFYATPCLDPACPLSICGYLMFLLDQKKHE